METKTKQDIYATVTNKIIAKLEAGVRPWIKPWSADHLAQRIRRPLRHNGEPYRGINVVMLWMTAEEMGFASPYFLTFNQIKELGGHVRKGEHGTPVVYASSFTKKTEDDNGEEVEEAIPFLKTYTVFNSQQADCLPERFNVKLPPVSPLMERIERADRFFANTGADIRTGGTKAYYCQSGDYIRMPPFETFRDAESFSATLGHECCHWSKAPHRLNRDLGGKRFGDNGYAMEELVAELGSAFLAADLELTPELRDDHAAYLQSWLTVLKKDARAIFTAATHASKAVDYLHSLQPTPVA